MRGIKKPNQANCTINWMVVIVGWDGTEWSANNQTGNCTLRHSRVVVRDDRGQRETLIRAHFLIAMDNKLLLILCRNVEPRFSPRSPLLLHCLLLHQCTAGDALCMGYSMIITMPVPRMFICVVNNFKQIKKWNATFFFHFVFFSSPDDIRFGRWLRKTNTRTASSSSNNNTFWVQSKVAQF